MEVQPCSHTGWRRRRIDQWDSRPGPCARTLVLAAVIFRPIKPENGEGIATNERQAAPMSVAVGRTRARSAMKRGASTNVSGTQDPRTLAAPSNCNPRCRTTPACPALSIFWFSLLQKETQFSKREALAGDRFGCGVSGQHVKFPRLWFLVGRRGSRCKRE